MADNIVYGATGLTGGTDHDLDGYDGDILVENDMALVIDDSNISAYTLKADSQAESSPTYIRPDSNPGTFTWHLVTIAVAAHTHDADTLQADGVTSDGGAFAFTTSGAITFSQNLILPNNSYYQGKVVAGGTSNVIGLDANDDIEIGGASNDKIELIISGDVKASLTGTQFSIAVGVNLSMPGASSFFGIDGSQRHHMRIYGGATSTGGKIDLYTAEDSDDVIEMYGIEVTSDDLIIGPATDTDSIKYDGGTGIWIFSGAAGVSFTGPIFGTGIKSGADQGAAGAAAGELYVDTNDDQTVKRGV